MKEFGVWESKADAVFDMLDTFPDTDAEAAIADTSTYRTLEQAVLPKGRNDCVKDFWSKSLHSLFQQSCVSKI